MLKSPETLAGARLWVVLQSAQESTLFGKLHVDMVERFEDGINSGDFFLTVDISKSFVCSREIEVTADSLKTSFTGGSRAGLETADEETDARMIAIVERNVKVKLQEFPKEILKKIEDVFLKGDVSSKAHALIAATTATFCLDELWSSGSKPKLPPFAHFAYKWLTEYCPQEASEDIRKVLSDLDPSIVTPIVWEPLNVKKRCESKSEPVIDINLSPIEPDKIFARRFVAKDPAGLDFFEVIEKTEHAEKKHQDMLREIASRLRSVGLNPMQSSSIDLFLQIREENLVFELKTATLNNLTSQCAKGLFQLGCYADALSSNGYENVHPAFIVETTGQTELDAYAAKIIASFDVAVFFYYPGKPWPEKVTSNKETLERMLSV